MPRSHLDDVRDAVSEIRHMASVCGGADLAAPVPSCPEWDLRALIRHTGMIHRWAATMVERRSQERLDRRELDVGFPDDDAGLPEWLDAGAGFVEARFASADPDETMWAWGWPKTAGFWPRRMIHETGIHRVDAQLAIGAAPTYDPDLAADGISELLDNLPHAAYFAPAVAELRGAGESIGLRAADTGGAWTITLVEDGFRWEAAARAADATLEAAAPDLLLTLYRRRPLRPDEVVGDGALLDRWLAGTAL